MSVAENAATRVVIIMGSTSDWETMRKASDILSEFGVPHECKVMSAHRSPDYVAEYIGGAEGRGVRVVIAGAGGAAHLAGVAASKTTLPVLGVPLQSKALQGLDSLLSTAQMPAGIPVATLAIGDAGATNAGLLAVTILALSDASLGEKLKAYRVRMAEKIRATEL